MKTKEKFIEEIYAKVERAEAAEREKRIKRMKLYKSVSAAAACFIVALGIYGHSVGGFDGIIGMRAGKSMESADYSVEMNGNPVYDGAVAADNDGLKQSEDLKAYGKGSCTMPEYALSDDLYDEAKLCLMSVEIIKGDESELLSVNEEGDVERVEAWIRDLSPTDAMGREKFFEMYPDQEPDSYLIVMITKETALMDEGSYIEDMHEPDRRDINTGEDSGYSVLTWYIVNSDFPKSDS